MSEVGQLVGDVVAAAMSVLPAAAREDLAVEILETIDRFAEMTETRVDDAIVRLAREAMSHEHGAD